MNCAYHSVNAAVVSCNGCGKPLCPACDHRIKGFPFCQNCIVEGVEMLRQRGGNSSYAPFIKKRSSPFLALLLSVCPGMGAAYNGQISKALAYFTIFVGSFQLVLLYKQPLFALVGLGIWIFSAIDSWRTAQMIRAGINSEEAKDIVEQRFSGNTKLWGIVLVGLGGLFFVQNLLPIRDFLRAALPVLIIALGIYLLRDYFFKDSKKKDSSTYNAGFESRAFTQNSKETSFRSGEFETDYRKESATKSWKTRY